MALPQLTTRQELINRYGEDAIEEWSDHRDLGGPIEDYIDYHIDWASNEIMSLLGERYELAQLQASALVSNFCMVLSAYFLSTSRGNPPPQELFEQFERVMLRLANIAKGSEDLRDDSGNSLATRGTRQPTLSNRSIDRRFHERKVRTDRRTGTQPPNTVLPRHKRDTHYRYL